MPALELCMVMRLRRFVHGCLQACRPQNLGLITKRSHFDERMSRRKTSENEWLPRHHVSRIRRVLVRLRCTPPGIFFDKGSSGRRCVFLYTEYPFCRLRPGPPIRIRRLTRARRGVRPPSRQVEERMQFADRALSRAELSGLYESQERVDGPQSLRRSSNSM